MSADVHRLGHVYKAGEAIRAGMYVTPDAEGRIFAAKRGDDFFGSMGVLDDLEPGDLVRFEMPRGGLGKKVQR